MDTNTSKQAEHALRQANRAAKAGDPVAAERWSKTAERLVAAVAAMESQREGELEIAQLAQAAAEEMVVDLFGKVAFLANVMLHEPMQAPAAFQGLIKLWRERNMGEGAKDAEAAAACLAASHAALLEGRFEDTLPDFVRERLDADWQARRADLAEKPVIPLLWENEGAG